MAGGYMVFTEAVHDPDLYTAYGRAARESVAKYGGRAVAASADPQGVEGQGHGNRTVILEFESVEAALAWYHSPEYQSVVGMRHASADCHAVAVDGLARRPPTDYAYSSGRQDSSDRVTRV